MVAKLTWYPAEDILYIQLSEEPFAYGRNFGDNTHVNFDVEDNPIGIEFVDVSEGIDLSDLPVGVCRVVGVDAVYSESRGQAQNS